LTELRRRLAFEAEVDFSRSNLRSSFRRGGQTLQAVSACARKGSVTRRLSVFGLVRLD
jgi:hypothetical protein